MNEAIEKLRVEMQDKENPYIKLIGEFLIQQVQADESIAEKILTEGKTIIGSLEAMKEAAKKKAVNGMAIFTDEEGFAIVLKYFGIKKEPVQFTPVQPDTVPTENNTSVNAEKKAKKPSKKKEKVPADDGFVQTTLDDFLGGAC